MKAYLPKPFQRDCKKDGISNEDCVEAIRKAEKGLVDADLGGGLIKQRIPRGNLGAARGSRAIVFYKRGKVAVFLYIFPKSSKADLKKSETAAYMKFAEDLSKELRKLSRVDLGARKGWRELEI
jgi:hypothetical protein